MKELNKLIEVCNTMNYNFFIQFYDGEFNVSVDDNNVQIDPEIASVGGRETLKEALIIILVKIKK